MTANTNTNKAISVFYSYSHEDERLRGELEKHLKILSRQGIISNWHDRKIGAGEDWKNQIDENLNTAQIILLLVSSDFLGSDYCYDVEMKRAMERHESGEARVIPVILRPVDWNEAPFSKLQALPTDAKPVTKWLSRDEAFTNITEGIKEIIKELPAHKTASNREESAQSSQEKKQQVDPVSAGKLPFVEIVSERGELRRSWLVKVLQEGNVFGGIAGLIITILACVGTYLALPQVQSFIASFQATPTTVVMATLTPTTSSFEITKPKDRAEVEVTEQVEGKSPYAEMNHYLFVQQGLTQYCQGPVKLSNGSWMGNAMFGQPTGVGAGLRYTIFVIATQSDIPNCRGQVEIPKGAIYSNSVSVIRK